MAKLDLSKDTLWTAEEFAAVIRSTGPSVRVQTSRGRFPNGVVVRVGRKVLYSRMGVERWLGGEEIPA